jgi:hypothetical protein
MAREAAEAAPDDRARRRTRQVFRHADRETSTARMACGARAGATARSRASEGDSAARAGGGGGRRIIDDDAEKENRATVGGVERPVARSIDVGPPAAAAACDDEDVLSAQRDLAVAEREACKARRRRLGLVC